MRDLMRKWMQVFASGGRAPWIVPLASRDDSPLDAFPSEQGVTAASASAVPWPRRRWSTPARTLLVGLTVLAAVVVVAMSVYLRDGRRTPPRTVAPAETAVVHHVEAPKPAPELKAPASIRLAIEAANLRVSVDGVARGVSPLTIEDLGPGPHTVQVTSGTRAPAPSTGQGPAAGWLTVNSPIALEVVEGKDIIGTTASPRIMLPAGRHELRLTSAALGFSERRVVQVTAGGSASLKVDVPTVPLNVNAIPWAEAWIDGKRIGETPIGNLPVRLGTHEVIFRHPELGERRQTITVTMNSPARVTVDMRKPGS